MMQKFLSLSCLLLWLSIPMQLTPLGAAKLPSAADLLARSNEAIGGLEAIQSKSSYSVRLRFKETDRDYRGFVWGRPPFDYRLEIHMNGIPGPVFTESSDGERVWRISLTNDGPKFEEEEWYYRPAFDFFGPTIDPAKKGIRYRVVGLTDFEGTRAYKVEVVYPQEKHETIYFARGSALPLGYKKSEEIDNEDKDVLTVVTEYDFIDDLLVSKRMNDFVDGKLRRTVILESLIFDEPLPDHLFEPPTDAQRWK